MCVCVCVCVCVCQHKETKRHDTYLWPTPPEGDMEASMLLVRRALLRETRPASGLEVAGLLIDCVREGDGDGVDDKDTATSP